MQGDCYFQFLLSPHGMRSYIVYCFFCLSVTPSTKSTNFGCRYLIERFQNGTKFSSFIEGALLYITTQIGELWPRASTCGAKIVKGVKKVL